MDQKISEFGSATTLAATDLIPIISSATNKIITAGVFSLNLPNLGNKGITKNTPLIASGDVIAITGTLVLLPSLMSAYTLPNGSDGQEITLVSPSENSVNFNTPTSTITMGIDSVVTLVFLSKWFIKSSRNITVV